MLLESWPQRNHYNFELYNTLYSDYMIMNQPSDYSVFSSMACCKSNALSGRVNGCGPLGNFISYLKIIRAAFNRVNFVIVLCFWYSDNIQVLGLLRSLRLGYWPMQSAWEAHSGRPLVRGHAKLPLSPSLIPLFLLETCSQGNFGNSLHIWGDNMSIKGNQLKNI